MVDINLRGINLNLIIFSLPNGNLSLLRDSRFTLRFNDLIVLTILILGFVLRVYGNNWGLPQLLHPDEPAIIDRAIRMADTGDLNPHWFCYPSFLIYLNYFVFKIEYILNSLGLIETDRGLFYLSGRYIGAILGSLTVLAVYFIGKALYNRCTGIIASIFLAIMPLAVNDSHYATTDVPLTFFITLCILFVSLIIKDANPRYYALAGIAAGLAISIKYTAGILIIPIVIGHLLGIKRNIFGYSILNIFNSILNRNLILSFILSIVAFFVGTPYSLIDFKKFWYDLIDATHLMQYSGAAFIGTEPGWIFHLKYSLRSGMAMDLEILSVLGVLYALFIIVLYISALYKDHNFRPSFLLLSWVLPYFIIIGSWSLKFDRYTIPLLPFLALLGASLLVNIINNTFKKIDPAGKKNAYKYLITSLAVIMLIISPTISSINKIENFTRVNTVQIALEWIENNIPENSTFIREHYTPEVELIKGLRCRVYDYNLSKQDLQELVKSNIDYIIISDVICRGYNAHPKEFSQEVRFYESLDDNFNPIKVFSPDRVHPGPEIKIYKISNK